MKNWRHTAAYARRKYRPSFDREKTHIRTQLLEDGTISRIRTDNRDFSFVINIVIATIILAVQQTAWNGMPC